jgi:hypothetical protein
VIESQSSAAAAILAGETNVAGIGGFSGRETTVSTKWLAMEVRDGKIRYLLNTTSGFGGGGAARRGAGTGSSTGAPSFGGRSGTGGFGAGDTRDGSAKAITAAEKVARKITVTENGTKVTLYDLQGKAAAILAQAKG